MKITVKNYLENRAMFLQSENPKIVELAQGTDTDLIEAYGQDATIDDAIDTAMITFNQYAESQSKAMKPKTTKRTSVSKNRAKSVSALKAKRTASVSAKVKSMPVEKVEAKPEVEATKPKPKKRTSVSKSRAKSVTVRKAKRTEKVVAKVNAKAVKDSLLNPDKATTKKLAKELSATLDKGDVVKDKALRKEIVVDMVDGNKFTGHEVKAKPADSKKPETAKAKPAVSKKPATAKAQPAVSKKPATAKTKPAVSKKPETAKAKPAAKSKPVTPKFQFSEGQLVIKGKMLFLVLDAKKDSVSLEEIDGKMLSNQSMKGFKAAPMAKLDERMAKERKAIAMLETKVKNESETLRNLHSVALKSYQSARALGKMPNATQLGKGASVKFDKLKSLIYQKSVLQSVHRKDLAALKAIVKKSNIDAKMYDKDLKDMEGLGMAKKSGRKPKSFHLLKPNTWF